MTNFKQNNPKWNRTKIRGTNLRIGEYGCLICCIATLSTYFGQGFGPQGAIDMTGFTPQGHVIFASGIYPDFKFDKIIKGNIPEEIKAALDHPDRAVILGINNAKHWVVACGIDEATGKIRIADPLGREDRELLRDRDTIDYMAFYSRRV